MTKLTQGYIRDLVEFGHAIDITTASSRNVLNETYEVIGHSTGKYGMNGLLLKGDKTSQLYAVTKRSTALFVFA